MRNVHDSSNRRLAMRLRARVLGALLDMAEQHGPLVGQVLPAQQPISRAIDKVTEQLDREAQT